jgi:hypothetical protein
MVRGVAHSPLSPGGDYRRTLRGVAPVVVMLVAWRAGRHEGDAYGAREGDRTPTEEIMQ